MKFYVNTSSLTDSPFPYHAGASPFPVTNDIIEQLSLELQYANPTTFLVSGYRGVGKTSLINGLIAKVGDRILTVRINLSKYTSYPLLIKNIIRELFISFDVIVGEKQPVIHKEFKLLYDRTFHDIVNATNLTKGNKLESVAKAEFNLKKLLPYAFTIFSAAGIYANFIPDNLLRVILFSASVIWLCLNSFTFGRSKTLSEGLNEEESKKTLYDDDIAEHHLFTVLKRLRDAKIGVAIAFDEMDKIEKEEDLNKIVNDIKPLLLSGFANFFIISGQSMIYQFEKSKVMEDQVISTLFSKNIHVPFLRYPDLKKFCLAIIADDELKSSELVNIFLDSQILHSSRIPRKLINLLRSRIIWQGSKAYIEISPQEEAGLIKDSRLVSSLTQVLDNKLPQIIEDKIKLDFFTAQIHIWIAKMKLFSYAKFRMSTIVDAESYKGKYPEEYLLELDNVRELLIDEMLENKILAIHHDEFDHEVESYLSWFYGDETAEIELTNTNGDQPENIGNKNDELPRSIGSHTNFLLEYGQAERILLIASQNLSSNVQLRSGNMSFLVKHLVNIKILSSTWNDSAKLREVTETRNSIAHGNIFHTDDAKIESMMFTLRRLRNEVMEQTINIIIRNILSGYTTQDKIGDKSFDLVYQSDAQILVFEIKFFYSTRTIDELITQAFTKYSNFTEREHRNVYCIIVIARESETSEAMDIAKINQRIEQTFKEKSQNIRMKELIFSEQTKLDVQIATVLAEFVSK